MTTAMATPRISKRRTPMIAPTIAPIGVSLLLMMGTDAVLSVERVNNIIYSYSH
jgi:hypothetical protein